MDKCGETKTKRKLLGIRGELVVFLNLAFIESTWTFETMDEEKNPFRCATNSANIFDFGIFETSYYFKSR